MRTNKILAIFLIAFLFGPMLCMGQSKKKADKEMVEWRYELEVVKEGVQGTYLVKVWSYSKKQETILEQAKKNAVHGILFKGFPQNGSIQGKSPLTNNPSLEQEKAEFFKEFFAEGGKYQKFVTLTNNGAIEPSDRINMGKEYKIGVIVSVNVEALRKDLEAAGVIKSLSSGF